MWKKDDIRSELQEISPLLAGLQQKRVYLVEDTYFQVFPQLLMQKISGFGVSSPVLLEAGKQPPYTVPAGYFSGLSADVLSRIKAATHENEIEKELLEIAPALASVSRTSPYRVPAGYFEAFEAKAAGAPAKVVNMQSHIRRVFRYAVAAVVIAIMVISGFIFFDKPEINTTSGEINVTAALESLSDEEIMTYLFEHSTSLQSTNAGLVLPGTEGNFEEIINELSDEDIQQILNQYIEPAGSSNRGT